MFNVYFNDGVNENVFLFTTTEKDKAIKFANKNVGKVLVDDEHGCSEDVFRSSKVGCIEVYDGEPIEFEDGDNEHPFFKNTIYQTPYFYTD